MRKIPLTEWLEFCRNYFSDLKGKDIYSAEVVKEVNTRMKELANFEQMLFRTKQLELPPDDFDQSFQQLLEANLKLGRKVPKGKRLEQVKERVRNFSQGKGAFIFFNDVSEQEAINAFKKLAKERGIV